MNNGEIWLNLGCGVHLLRGFINVDREFDYDDLANKEGIYINAEIDDGASFVRSDIRKLPFEDDYADYILATHVLEHIPMRDIGDTLLEWRRVIKPTGYIYFTVPNFDDIAQRWVEEVINNPKDDQEYWDNMFDVAQAVYGNQITEGEYHRNPLNPRILCNYLNIAQFPYYQMVAYPRWHPAVPIKGFPMRAGDWRMKYGEIHVKAMKVPQIEEGGPIETAETKEG